VLLRDVDFIRPRHELQTYSFPVERRELPVLQDPVQADAVGVVQMQEEWGT
ncbi:unnamed protein product, partial [Durusdinium trenchii]